MKPATHQGHCQLCNRVQRAPGFLLAKHGYTVEFNFFNGTCPGSGHKAYEEDCSLLPPQREIALKTAAEFAARAKETRKLTDATKVWVHEWVKDLLGYRGGYEWRQVEVTLVRGFPKFIGKDSKQHDIPHYTAEGYDTPAYLANIIKALNGKRADEFAQRSKQHADYAVWCEQRVKAWKPKPLIAIKQAA